MYTDVTTRRRLGRPPRPIGEVVAELLERYGDHLTTADKLSPVDRERAERRPESEGGTR